MITVEHFRMEHLATLAAQGVQSSQVSYVPASFAGLRRPPGVAMTALEGDRIVLCGGIIPNGPGLGVLWAVLAADAGKHMLWLHRGVRRFLTLERWRRIEASVEEGFAPGCRWLELLGFEYEGRMRAYGPHGETHVRYAKVL